MQINRIGHDVIPGDNAICFTGTADQPHSIILFHKSPTQISTQHYGAVADGLGGFLLIGNVVGLIRIKNVVKEIFANFNNPNAPHDWKKHVFYNIVRGLLEIIPGFGLFILIYDTSYKMSLFENTLLRELSTTEPDCCGVMRDGEIIAIMPYQNIANRFQLPQIDDTQKLGYFKENFWDAVGNANKSLSLSMEETIQSLRS